MVVRSRKRGRSHRTPLPGLAVGLLLTAFLPPQATGAEPRSFTVSQAHAELPQVVVYTAATDEHEAPYYEGEITASLAGRPLRIARSRPLPETDAGVAYVVLLDVSQSLHAAQFAEIRQTLREQIGELRAADRMAVITFGDDVKLACDFTADRSRLTAALDSLAPAARRTKLHEAVVRAMGMAGRRDPDLPTRRVALLLSDGKDEGSGQTVEDVLAAIREHHLPLYALGFSALAAAERGKYLAVLNRFAALSGGRYLEASGAGWRERYKALRESVLAVRLTEAYCDGCATEGGLARLQVTLTAGGKVLTDGLDLRLLPASPEPPSPVPVRDSVSRVHPGVWVAAGVATIAGVGLFVFFRLRRLRRGGPALSPAFERIPEPAVGSQQVRPESPPPPAPYLRLAVVRGASPGQTFAVPLNREVLVGRSSDCDLTVEGDDTVSGRHFRLFYTGGRLVIQDAGSANGTVVNGAPISGEYPLADGDLIAAGHTEMRVRIEEDAP